MLGVSRASVREAMIALEVIGLVLDAKQLVAYVVLEDPASADDWQAAPICATPSTVCQMSARRCSSSLPGAA